MTLAELSNDEIMTQLMSIRAEGSRLLARLIAMLIEVEDRRIFLELACSSMFDFLTRKLGMSEGEAHRRLNAARLARRFPQLLDPIGRGELHLSALQLLARHLTPENVDALAREASHKTKSQIEELLARVAPSSDVLPAIHTLPETPRLGAAPASASPPATPARIAPVSATRHEVRFTASTEQREKLERARELMRHANPGGDLAMVVERGLDLLIAKLEKERLGRVARPRKVEHAAKTDRVTRSVRREVFARDGERCTFLSEAGERCPARTFLELDHIEARALGGASDAANLRVRCRAHNRLHAEAVFGKERVARAINFRQRKSPVTRAACGGVTATMLPADVEALDAAACGLTNMGFRQSDAKRALARVLMRRPPGSAKPGVQDLVRDALAVLS